MGSRLRPQTASVPQGSVFEPFLFKFYVNSIANMENNVGFITYADHMRVFFRFRHSAHSAHDAITDSLLN